MALPFDPHSPFLVAIAKPITFLGDEYGLIIVLALLYWLYDTKNGLRIAVVTLISAWFNGVLKTSIGEPRPSGTQYVEAGGSGMPSGHAQNSVSMYGTLAVADRNRITLIVGLVLPLLIGLSRVILNVHTMTQVLVGWLVGAAIVAVYYYSSVHVEKWYSKQSKLVQYATLFGAYLVMIIISVSWHENSEALHGAVIVASGFLGMTVGHNLQVEYVKYRNSRRFVQNVLRTIVGLVLVGVVLFGLGAILPDSLGELGATIKYSLTGFTASFVAPWFFEQLPFTRSAAEKRE